MAILCAVALLTLVCAVPVTAAQQPRDDPAARFQAHLADYVTLRDRLRQDVAPEHIIDPRIREVSGALLAAKIRQARADAQPSDIIPAALADVIRDRLHRAFDPTEVDVLLMNLYPEGVPLEPTRINMHYGHHVAVSPPLNVLTALPPLPGVLGYRLVGQDIVIWDEEAEIVIDLIASALPEPRIWKFLDVSSFALRDCVRDGLRAAHLDPQALLDDITRDEQPGAAPPVVGEMFDWNVGTAMPPSVLHRLPPLPKPLEYRFAGSDLVVINIDTGIVEGILHSVLPRRATGPVA